MSDQPNLLEVIARNTIAVMTGAPEHKEDWFNNVQRILR
jgi:hypothetical protein